MDAVTIVGLVEFGLSCASAISNVISDIHGGSEDVRKLITQIEAVVLVVKELDRVIDENKRTKGFDTQGLVLLKHSREECEQILIRLRSLLVKAGATVTTHIQPGKFYKIRATDIDRSTFRTANWARHKRKFDEVTKELEAVKNTVLVALQVYSFRVARRADDKEQKLRELFGLLQYLKDSGKTLEDIIPPLPSTTSPSNSTETPVRTSLFTLGPGTPNPGMHRNPKTGRGSDSRNRPSGNNNAASRHSASTSSIRSSPPNAAVARPEIPEGLEIYPLWQRALRDRLALSLRYPTNGPDTKERNNNSIPECLRDQSRPDGIALTRSFLLSESDSGDWTFCTWEYPFDELLKRLNRKGIGQDALRTLGRLPQPCKDLITHISKDIADDGSYWSTLFIDPVSSGKRCRVSRLLTREAARANSVSSVLAVLKLCRNAVDFDGKLTTALQELGTFISSEIRTRVESELSDAVHERTRANELLTRQANDERLKAEREKERLKLEVERIRIELDVAKAQAEAKAVLEAKIALERQLLKEAYEKALAQEKAAKDNAIAEVKYLVSALQLAREDAHKKAAEARMAGEADAKRPAEAEAVLDRSKSEERALEEEIRENEHESRRSEARRRRPPPINNSFPATPPPVAAPVDTGGISPTKDTCHNTPEALFVEERRLAREERARDDYFQKYETSLGNFRAEERARKARERLEKEKREIERPKEGIESDYYARFMAVRRQMREEARQQVNDEQIQEVKSRQAEESAEEKRRVNDEERLRKLDEMVIAFRDKQKESEDQMLQRAREGVMARLEVENRAYEAQVPLMPSPSPLHFPMEYDWIQPGIASQNLIGRQESAKKLLGAANPPLFELIDPRARPSGTADQKPPKKSAPAPKMGFSGGMAEPKGRAAHSGKGTNQARRSVPLDPVSGSVEETASAIPNSGLLHLVAESEKLSPGIEDAARNALKAYSGFGELFPLTAETGSDVDKVPWLNRGTPSEGEETEDEVDIVHRKRRKET